MKTKADIAAAPTNLLKVESYIKKHAQWNALLVSLRKLLLKAGLEETIKWGSPAYTLNGKLVVSLVAFKQHCALWFHQGVFLSDKQQVLVNVQEGKTQAMRQWRFDHDSKLPARLVAAYVKEAITNAQAGKQLAPKVREMVKTPELEQALQQDRALQRAFAALTPGKQREYAEHIGAAKQAKTRMGRLQKAIPLIKAGVGLNDKYRNG